ncbi:cytochrome P450 [Jatrophihabitans sp.]|uniref:cytochrome P450 n=1 Tax=Jatrophihabitans sp. TaxID=1932789 RepID=UPI002B752A4D|nr:cytochrome P450 [Jatrophihabitans sp.]
MASQDQPDEAVPAPLDTLAAPAPLEIIRELVGSPGRTHPYPRYELLRAHGPVVPVRPGLTVVVGYAECDAALRNSQLRVQDGPSYDAIYPDWREHPALRGYIDSMLYRNPPDHARMRGLVSGGFTPRRVSGMRTAVTQLTDRLLDRLAVAGAGGAPVEFVAEFASRLPIAVISALLGVPEHDQAWFRRIAADVTIALEGITNSAELAVADLAMAELGEYFLALISRRRLEPVDDVVSALVHGSEQLAEQELVANMMLLLTAGFETTSFLLGHCLLLALRSPGLARRLRTEPGFEVGYVEETLRFETPVQATSRWAATELDLLGHPIPAGTKVVLILGAANRDPRRYARPDRFDPDRGTSQPLSFGAGSHFCLGAPLSRMEAQIALPRLLRRFPELALAGPPVRRDTWVGRGLDELPIRLG